MHLALTLALYESEFEYLCQSTLASNTHLICSFGKPTDPPQLLRWQGSGGLQQTVVVPSSLGHPIPQEHKMAPNVDVKCKFQCKGQRQRQCQYQSQNQWQCQRKYLVSVNGRHDSGGSIGPALSLWWGDVFVVSLTVDTLMPDANAKCSNAKCTNAKCTNAKCMNTKCHVLGSWGYIQSHCPWDHRCNRGFPQQCCSRQAALHWVIVETLLQ